MLIYIIIYIIEKIKSFCKKFLKKYKKGVITLIDRMKHAITGENGSVTVETIVAISVALTFVIALGGLAATVITWLAGATGAVSSLHE